MDRNHQIRYKQILRIILITTISISINMSVLCADSRIVIEGRSSIIIESMTSDTKIVAKKIETSQGGSFVCNNFNNQFSSNNTIEALPESFVIEEAFPNPFNPTTKIKYGINKINDIDIYIYSMTGKLIDSHQLSSQSPGWHEFLWMGTDSNNQQVSSGIYLVTMRVGENIKNQKVTYIK